MDPTTPLAEGFPRADRDAWAALARQTLGGAEPESLDRPTLDGLTLRALYDADGEAPLQPRPARRTPGWDVRAEIAEPDPLAAEAAIEDALAAGASSILVVLAGPRRAGVRIADPAAFQRLTRAVLTDIAPVALDAGPLGGEAAAWLDAVAKASPAAPLAFHLDPLGAWAPGSPVAEAIAAGAAQAARLAEIYPKASLFLASGRLVHEAGGTPVAELAFAAAAALAYAKALAGAGLSVPAAWERVVLGLAAEAEPIAAIAKLRAARLLWARLVGACGAAAPARIEARASRRMLTTAQPWTNLVRLTCAGFAAAVGGADALVLPARGWAPEGTDPRVAARLAVGAQMILAEEAHLGRVADPAGGAFALEAHSRDLARAAWDRFQAIERAGGALAALESGLVAAEVEAGRQALARDLASGARRILGVTDFAADGARAPPRQGRGPLAPIRLEDLA